MPLTCPSLVSMVFITNFFDWLSIIGLVSLMDSAEYQSKRGHFIIKV